MFGVVLTRKLGQIALQNQKSISTVAVIGAGVMGHGIAQASAVAGNNVILYDLTPEYLDAAKKNITTIMKKSIKKKMNTVPYLTDEDRMEKEVQSILSQITYTTDIGACFDNTDLVIEAIFENLDAKRKLFSRIENLADQKTIFGTNSATLSVPEIARDFSKKDRFLGIHFFFPVHKTDTVELVRLNETSELTAKTISEWVWTLGKTPEKADKRSPMTSKGILTKPPDINGPSIYKELIY